MTCTWPHCRILHVWIYIWLYNISFDELRPSRGVATSINGINGLTLNNINPVVAGMSVLILFLIFWIAYILPESLSQFAFLNWRNSTRSNFSSFGTRNAECGTRGKLRNLSLSPTPLSISLFYLPWWSPRERNENERYDCAAHAQRDQTTTSRYGTYEKRDENAIYNFRARGGEWRAGK